MKDRMTIEEFIEWLKKTYENKLDYKISYINFYWIPEDEPYIDDEDKKTSIE